MPNRLLAVDTATEICGVALLINGKVVTELILDRNVTHTQTVVAAIDAVMGINHMKIADVDAYAVTQGPGSFTGLRIGISTLKGLAHATRKPLVGISSLAVLAHQAPSDTDTVCPLMDARRNEVYWALYRREGAVLSVAMDERAGPAAEVADAVDKACYFIGNAVPHYRASLSERLVAPATWANDELNALRPAVLARLAWRRLREAPLDDPMRFSPVYLRKSDAELHQKGSAKG